MKKFFISFLLLFTVAVVSLINLGENSQIKAGVGNTIAETFSDPKMAQAVAGSLHISVDAVLTQDIIDNTTELNVEMQQIEDISGIEVFVNLQRLWLSTNELTELPDSIGDLVNLEELYCGENNITSLPDSIGNLTKLRRLQVYVNQLISLPDSIGNLVNLEELSLYENELTSIPESIGNLTKLQELTLQSNRLVSLPDSIGNLTSIWFFDLYYNQITSLPDSIGNLTNLYYFPLAGNQLTSLPNSIGNLNQAYMELSYNLLPENYASILEGLGFMMGNHPQSQLILTDDTLSFNISSQEDIDNIEYESILLLERNNLDPSNPYYGTQPSLGHTYILDNYEDENGQAVDIGDYIQNGIVIKEGTIYAHVRATGTGLFPNTSENALTPETIELNLILPPFYDLSFNLNGGDGTAPDSQQVMEGELLTAVADPVRSGYSFKGWNTSIDGSGTTWDFATNTMPAEDIILYAIWAENTTGTEDNDTTATEDTADSLPQTGMYIYLIAGATALVTGTSLIIVNKKR